MASHPPMQIYSRYYRPDQYCPPCLITCHKHFGLGISTTYSMTVHYMSTIPSGAGGTLPSLPSTVRRQSSAGAKDSKGSRARLFLPCWSLAALAARCPIWNHCDTADSRPATRLPATFIHCTMHDPSVSQYSVRIILW